MWQSTPPSEPDQLVASVHLQHAMPKCSAQALLRMPAHHFVTYVLPLLHVCSMFMLHVSVALLLCHQRCAHIVMTSPRNVRHCMPKC